MNQGLDREQINKYVLKNKLINDLEEAQKFCQEGDWEKLILKSEEVMMACWHKLLSTVSEENNRQNYIYLGDILLGKAQINSHLSLYTNVDYLKSELIKKYQIIGVDLIKENQIKEAVKYYLKASELNEHSPEIQNNLGSLYAKQENWHQAIIHYQKAIKLNPKFAGVYRNLARVISKTQGQEQAADYWYQAFILEPNLASATEYFNLGKNFVQQQEYKKAINCYQQAINLKPDFVEAHNCIADLLDLLEQKGKKKEAVEAYYQLASLLVKQQKYPLAIQCYRRILNLTKALGYTDKRLIKEYKNVIKLYPKTSPIDYYYLAKLLRAESNFLEAIKYFQKAILLKSDFEPAYVELQYTRTDTETTVKMIDFYRKLLENDNSNPFAWGNLGDALTENRNIKEAIVCYQNSCYHKTIRDYPHLVQGDGNKKKSTPNFIIIGALKSGTTSLFEYLGYHPQVLLPRKKEIDFFSQKFNYGVDWYLAHFPAIIDNSEFITGESTPVYLSFTGAEKRIFSLFPQVKLIVLLRNPVDQVISWHYHRFNYGLYKKTLPQAINTELKPIKNCSEAEIMRILNHHKYNLMGALYVYHLKRWLQIFPREQLLIIKSEEFYANPAKTMEQAFQFLGIEDYQVPEFPRFNSGYYAQVNERLRKRIAAYFRPHNQKLEEFLGMQFNWD